MKSINIPVAEYAEIEWDPFIRDGMDAQDVPDFVSHLQNIYPPFVNRSSTRKDERIPLVTEFNGKLYWNGCVGIFHTLYPQDDPKYNVTIRIRSRFDTEDKHYFLAALLQSWVEKSTNLANYGDLTASGTWDEIFDFITVSVFRQQLMNAYDAGIFRAYQYFEENSCRFRGSIDIPRHIRLNIGLNNGKVATRYRDNTPDNAMNHLVLHAYNELKQRHPHLVSMLIDGDACGAILDNLRYLAPSYKNTRPAAVAAKLCQPISNPLYETYENLRCLCLRILDDQGSTFLNEEKNLQNSFLFYTPDLWENFIEHHITSKLTSGRPAPQYKVNCLNGMTLRPDFVFFKGNERIVLDAKYKEKWKYFPKSLGIEDDIKQCLVYYAVLQADYTGVIIPVSKRMKEQHCRQKISDWDMKKGGSFRVFDVLIPSSTMDSYQLWREALTENEAEAARRIDAFCRKIGVCSQEGKQ